jgi:hypothetical protein
MGKTVSGSIGVCESCQGLDLYHTPIFILNEEFFLGKDKHRIKPKKLRTTKFWNEKNSL